MEALSLRFVRWAAWFLPLGLLSGYAPLGHYLMEGTDPACSWAPVHGHLVLLGWVGMTLYGLVYRALPSWAPERPPSLALARAHFWLSAAGIAGVLVNGLVGYPVLDALSEASAVDFYLALDGLFLSLFGAGGLLFVVVVYRATRGAGPGERPAAS